MGELARTAAFTSRALQVCEINRVTVWIINRVTVWIDDIDLGGAKLLVLTDELGITQIVARALIAAPKTAPSL